MQNIIEQMSNISESFYRVEEKEKRLNADYSWTLSNISEAFYREEEEE